MMYTRDCYRQTKKETGILRGNYERKIGGTIYNRIAHDTRYHYRYHHDEHGN